MSNYRVKMVDNLFKLDQHLITKGILRSYRCLLSREYNEKTRLRYLHLCLWYLFLMV